MSDFAQQLVNGLITGSLYGLLGLAFVLVYRATGVINFSQGEMATFTTFVAWTLAVHLPYLVVFVLTLAIGFGLGAVTERVVVRPVLASTEVNALTAVIGLFLAFSALTLGLYGADVRRFDTPISGSPLRLAGVVIPRYSLFVFLAAALLMTLLYLFFQRTSLGLALRATASDRETAELMGVRTNRMLLVGWGLAGAMGSAAGLLLAPIVGLTSQMMLLVIVSALSGVLIGGLTSPIGAVLGGVLIGVVQNLVGTYLDDAFSWFGFTLPDPNSFREIAAVILLLVVLLVRPGGLLGRSASALERV